jgi:Protein of unknown function (DUF2914)
MIRKLLWAIAALAVLMPATILAQAETATLKAEAQLCTGVQDRMPTGMADSFSPEVGQVYLWCKITGATDPNTIIKVVWSYQGKEKATVELAVKSSSWRTWSAKKILPEWTGDWSVKVVDASGNVLKELSFKIAAPATQ